MIILILGFLLLVFGADLLVNGASNIAKRFHIPEMLIGLTIVAIGTSTPELIITITSSSTNATDLILGNAIGSNLCNLLLILGFVSVLKPITIDKETRLVHLPVALVSTLAILGIGLGILGTHNNVIGKLDGTVLVILYLLYFFYPIIIELKDIIGTIKEKNPKKQNIFLSVLFIILGVIALKTGGDFVVDKSVEIAIKYGISESVIGLTIVAVGTALPEFITSIVAIIKNEEGLAVGNLIGSCIFNSFLIIGVGAIITPIAFSKQFIHNIILLALSTLLIGEFCYIGKKNTITRFKGGILLTIYFAYIINLFK